MDKRTKDRLTAWGKKVAHEAGKVRIPWSGGTFQMDLEYKPSLGCCRITQKKKKNLYLAAAM